MLQYLKKKWVLAIIAAVVLIGGYWFLSRSSGATYQFVTVTRGPIEETVSITGNTTPIQSVSLGFQSSGTIAHVYHALGTNVAAGETIADLDTTALSAALAQAQAAYAAALASRSSTSLPEVATQARNAYLSAYTTLDTQLKNYVDLFFGSNTAYGPQLLINASMYSFGELSKGRSAITAEMLTYQSSLAGAASADPGTLLTNASGVAQDVASFLDKLAVAANSSDSSASAAQLSALATARSGVTSLLTTLSTARDTYLTKSVGATTLADANVEQARAGVAAAEANFQGTKIIAPISGTLTQQDAKVGQLASPGTPLVSIIGSTGFEVDADASETDVGKLSVGDKVTMTLDAFSNETFTGKVFYLAPAETNTGGVVSYLTKVSFDNADERIKSGLTANLDIQTNHKDDVLYLPQYAILQNDEGAFVETLEGKTIVKHPVTLGIQDAKGNVEILSGVSLGEQVVNVGLKSQ
jgi:membrane fusion protein (multidrug efflux system)